MEFPCFLYDPENVGNLISASSAFSKPSLNIWKFSVHIMLKPSLRILNITSTGDECNCVVVWAFFGITFLWDWNENWLFPVLCPLLSFQICWYIECNTFTTWSFRILNTSAGVTSLPLALLHEMFPWYIQFFWRELYSFSHSSVSSASLHCSSLLAILWNSGTQHLFGCIFPFLPCFLLLFSAALCVKPPQTTTLPFCISFSLGWFWSLTLVQWYKLPSIVFQAFCLPDLIPWIYSSPPLYNHNIGYIWMA